MGENKMVPYFTLDLEASFSIPNILENQKQLEEMNANEAKESKSKSKSKEAKDPSIVAFMSCHRIKTQKRKLKMLMNTSKLRQAKIYRNMGIIAMDKDEDWAFDMALEYLNKSWKVNI